MTSGGGVECTADTAGKHRTTLGRAQGCPPIISLTQGPVAMLQGRHPRAASEAEDSASWKVNLEQEIQRLGISRGEVG